MLHQQSSFDFDDDDDFSTLENGCRRHSTRLGKDFKLNPKKAIGSNNYSSSEFDEAYSGFGSLHVQYFLANLCDYEINDDDRNLDKNTFRHPRTPFAPEIDRICRQFFNGRWLNPNDYDVKIIMTILKEYLFQIEGGVFNLLTKEFFEISLESPLDMTMIYLHSIVHELPYSVQQSVYLLCKSVQNLLRLAGGPTSAAYTDLLMNLTPCVFADSWSDTKFFLRCSRLLLIMIQNRPQVFLPLPFMDECGEIQWLNDEMEFAEKIFLLGFFDKVHRLENQLSAESVDSGIGLDENQSVAANLMDKLTTRKFIDQNLSTPDLYRLTFSIDLEE